MQKLVNFILADCAMRDIEVHFVCRVPDVPANWMGTYDGSNIYIKRCKDWPLVLAHEYCHSRQDMLNTYLWNAYQNDDSFVGRMERECEQMVLGLLEIFSVDVDYAFYANEHLKHYGESI